MQIVAENLTTVSHVIQLAVAPVFLLTGVGAICMFILVSNYKIVAAWLENTKSNNLKTENQK